MSLPTSVKIYEVGPRDGLQNENQIIPVDVKLSLIKKLSQAGLKNIEATSFVSPKWVPQMADHIEIMTQLEPSDTVSYPVLVPNMKGMENALQSGVKEVAVFASASESFSQKNINASIEESLERFAPVMALAKQNDVRVRGYVSCVAGCPYEGDVAFYAVANVLNELARLGCYEISLGDTIGVGTPEQVKAMLKYVSSVVPMEKIALHCHDTYGQALANIYAGLQMGVSVIDSSVGGLGGCPYAEGASGNVATEDVLYMLEGMGIETGVDLNAIIDTAWFISNALGREPSSKVSQAKRPQI